MRRCAPRLPEPFPFIDTGNTTIMPFFEQATETMPRDRLAELQVAKLRAMSHELWRRNRFYTRKWQEAGIEPGDIKTLDDLQREVAAARTEGRSVMLDFYADWCVSCKEMEKYTFTDGAVQAALADTKLLQADVTANDADDQALLKHFGIFGPPTIAFYGADGVEQTSFRVVGYMKAPAFADVVQQAVSAKLRASETGN